MGRTRHSRIPHIGTSRPDACGTPGLGPSVSEQRTSLVAGATRPRLSDPGVVRPNAYRSPSDLVGVWFWPPGRGSLTRDWSDRELTDRPAIWWVSGFGPPPLLAERKPLHIGLEQLAARGRWNPPLLAEGKPVQTVPGTIIPRMGTALKMPFSPDAHEVREAIRIGKTIQAGLLEGHCEATRGPREGFAGI